MEIFLQGTNERGTMRRLIIYTDGSASYRDKTGGWAFVVFCKHKIIHSANGTLKDTTTGRAELEAMLQALTWLTSQKHVGSSYVRTDSKYVKRGATEWIHGWETRGWTTVEGKEVKNRDLWEQISPLVEEMPFPLKIQWVRGHSGIYGNEVADHLAGLGRKGIRVKHVRKVI